MGPGGVAGQEHPAPLPVHTGDRALAEGDVGLPVEQAPDRVGHVGRVQPRRRHLVEQRLERREVLLVDERDLDRRLGEAPGGGEPTEPGADDDDLRSDPHAGSSPPAVASS
jgi:hypothetical protein